METGDRHAETRDTQSRKRRYGMRIAGTSVRVLARLQQQPKPPKRTRKSARRKVKRRTASRRTRAR